MYMQSGSDRYCDGIVNRAEKKEMEVAEREKRFEEYLK
jgi:hypothetical protein